jgi:hypothetical protein
VDYTHIVFDFDDKIEEVRVGPGAAVEHRDGYALRERLPEGAETRPFSAEELERRRRRFFETFTGIAEEAGGNQIVLRLYEFLKLLSVEVYDRYMGRLTLADSADRAAHTWEV